MLGSLISAGASLLGGFLGRKDAEETRRMQMEHAAKQEALQREFAQSGIQWRVADAKKAGIHPIYALGSGGATYTPTAAAFSTDTSLPSALASAGQDIGRAVNATQSTSTRINAFTKAAQALSLEKGQLENEVLKLEIASKAGRLRQENAPAMPTAGDAYLIPGQGNSPVVNMPKDNPLERVTSAPGAPQQEHGAIPDVGYARTRSGWAPVPSKDVKERIEDNLIQEVMWSIRNNVFPSFGMYDPPKFSPGEDRKWVYAPWAQEYQSWRKPSWKRKPPASGGSGW